MNPRRPLLPSMSLLACAIFLAGAGGPLTRIVIDADTGAAPDDIGAPLPPDGGTPQDGDASTGADGGTPSANGWEKRIADLLKHPTLKGVALSIQGVNLRTGKEVFAFAPDVALNPASVTKVVTSAAALEYLGPHFAWATEVLVEKESLPGDDGVVTGNLYVRGYGDPQLTSERVFLLVTELMERGLTKVTGDLVIDDSWFDGEREPRGWEKQRGEGAYYAGTGAVSVNFNSVTVHVRPGTEGNAALVTIEPVIPYVKLVNNAKTTGKGKRSISVKIKPKKGGEEVEVKGSIPVDDEGKTYYRRVSDPPIYAGQLIKETMRMRGLKFGGKIKAGKAPDDADLFWTYFSQKLAVIARDMNKASNNFTAEQALKTVGGLRGAPASFDKGLAAMEEWLEKAGVKKGAYTMTNGSGLSHKNRFTSAQIVKVLQYAWGQFKWQPDFVSSMSIASGDGTVRKRYRGAPASFKLRAKTGSIDGVAALCGYVPNAAGDVIAFSVIANGFAQKKYREVTYIEDDIANALAESR